MTLSLVFLAGLAVGLTLASLLRWLDTAAATRRGVETIELGEREILTLLRRPDTTPKAPRVRRAK